MDSEPRADSPDARTAQVALVLADILATDDQARELILDEFLSAAWPSALAQRQ